MSSSQADATTPSESIDAFVSARLGSGALDPEYLAAVRRLYEYPSHRRALSERDRALVLLATEVLVTQLNADGVERGVATAVAAGATRDEILATVQLASVIGLHSITFGVPRLRRTLEERGSWPPPSDERLDVVVRTGYRGKPVVGMLRDIAQLDPEYFVVFRDALEIPWTRGTLGDGLMQLICIAIDACASHLYEEGLELHFREALDAGVSASEILEVLQLCSITGLRSIITTLPVLERTFPTTPRPATGRPTG